MKRPRRRGYHCRSCGRYHDELPLVYGPDAPVYWDAVPEAERARRFEMTSDQAVLDGEHFFIRGRLEIPIIGHDEPFAWLVWTTLSRANFERATDLWHTPGREQEPPYFGWLSTALPYEPDTVNLKTMVHTRPVGIRPYIEVEATDHPLAAEQRTGITWERVQEIAELVLHGPRSC